MTIFKMPVRRLRDGFILLISVPLIVFAIFLGMAHALQQQTVSAERWSDHSNEVLLGTQRLVSLLAEAEWTRGDVGIASDHGSLVKAGLALNGIAPQLAELRRLVQDNPAQEAAAKKISDRADRGVGIEYRLLLLRGTGASPETRSAAAELQRLTPDLLLRLRNFTAEEQRLGQIRKAAQQAAWLRFQILMAFGAAVGCLTVIGANLGFGNQIVRGLERLAANAKKLAKGEEAAAPMPGPDEISQLDRTFHEMAAQLKERRVVAQRYALLASRAHDIILFARRSDLRIIEANAAAAAYGYTRDELLQLTGYDISATSSSDVAIQIAALNDSNTVYETVHRRKDGTSFPVEASSQITVLEGERIVVSVIRDLTERKITESAIIRAEALEAGKIDLEREIAERIVAEARASEALDRALAASRLKSEFVATMSHEIRTPMNGVIGMNELLLDTPLNEEQRGYAQDVQGSARALLVVINDILDFSKIEAGHLVLETDDIDVSETVESAATLLALAARNKGVKLMTYVDPPARGFVRGDAGRLRQILVNLIGNAVKFTDVGSIIVSVYLDPTDDRTVTLRFAVKDSGIGIDAAALESIFEAFRQADGSITRSHGGTGLGLSISRRLVELMAGKIWVGSTPGAGSTFSFTAKFEHSMKQTTPRSIADSAARTLVVDDDPVSREILHRYIVSWGVDNKAAANADQALTILREAAKAGAPFAVAILDYMMPDVDGIRLAERIKADPLTADTRLILVTASDLSEQGPEVIAPLFSRYLRKPVRQSQLFDCIASAIESRNEPAAKVAHIENAAPAAQASSRRPEQILVVEDQHVNGRLALQQLKKLGFAAEAVTNGELALQAVSHKKYDVVFMDCQMPVMDGFTATRAIRKWEARSRNRVPIIAMTANARSEDRDECLAAGMDDYLPKPVQMNDLRELLERWAPAKSLQRDGPSGDG